MRRTHELGEVRTGDSGRGARMARVLTSGRHMRGPRGGRWQCLGWRPAGGSTDPDPHAPKRRVGVRTRARLAHGGNRPTSARFPAPAGTRAEPLMAPRGRSGLRSKGVCPEHICKRKQIGASANEASQRASRKAQVPVKSRESVLQNARRAYSLGLAGPLGCRPCTQGRPLHIREPSSRTAVGLASADRQARDAADSGRRRWSIRVSVPPAVQHAGTNPRRHRPSTRNRGPPRMRPRRAPIGAVG